MRLLVTGGAGFIGSNFIRYVLDVADDVQVTNLDGLTYAGNLSSLEDLDGSPRYRFVHGDIRDADLVAKLVAGADAVVNFAAESHVDRSIEDPTGFLTTNVVGAGVVFEACRQAEVERVLHISTDEVYGSVEPPGAFSEDDRMSPNSPYAVAKAAADLLAIAYNRTYGYPITVSRTTNNFGPYQFPEKLIPFFITNLLDHGSVPLYGDGGNVRDWTYVEDSCAAQWLVLQSGDPGGVYNVGAGNERSNLELTMALLDRFGLDERVIEYVPDRPGHDRRYAVDSSRVRSLGWAPAHSFEEALGHTVEWYARHQDWWRPLRQLVGPRRLGQTEVAKAGVPGA